jgi:hypothetical protein
MTLAPIFFALALALPMAAHAERECRKNRDCQIVVPPGCCDTCAREPEAHSKKWQPEACGCALKEPDPLGPGCPHVDPAELFRAVCKRGKCERVLRVGKRLAQAPQPAAQPEETPNVVTVPPENAVPPEGRCDADDDCLVNTWAGCCSVCAGAPQAVSRAWHPPACGCAMPRPSGPKVEIGADGKPVIVPDQPRCAPVESAGAFRAACQAHRCTLVRK